MALYPLQGPPHAGATITFQAPGGTAGDTVTTGQGLALMVLNNNGAGTAVSVVLPVVNTWDGLAVASRVVSVPAVSAGLPGVALIPVPDNVYGVGTTAVTYGTVVNVSVASVRIP